MSFSKKYTSNANPDEFIFITWDTGYKNVRVYHNSKLVDLIPSPQEIMKGYSRQQDGVGLLDISFTDRPITLSVSIDGVFYFAENSPGSGNEYISSVSGVFWFLAAAGALSSLFILYMVNFRITIPAILIELIIDICVVTIYTLAAIFCAKERPWAFFLGSMTFLGMTLLYAAVTVATNFNFLVVTILVVRIAILIFMVGYIKKAFNLLSIRNKKRAANPEILDF